ncbi:MAG: hypothetical protein CL906_01940 [Dehalococcoidia bacterium]|nr:hypothetical protein [Dehalococcoidia bacterium]
MKNSILKTTLLTNGFVESWSIGGVSSFCRFFEVLVSAVVIYQISQNALLVAINSGLRVAPLFILGWLLGRMADSLDKRYLLVLSSIVFIFSSLIGFLLMFLGLIQVWHLLVISLISGLGWAIEFPSRRSFIGEVLPKKNIYLGIGLDLSLSNLGRFIGPVVAGLMIDYLLNFAFLLSAFLYIFSLIMSLMLFNLKGEFTKKKKDYKKSPENIFLFLFKNNMYRTVLLVTIVCNIWGFPTTSMVPVIAETILNINATLLGILVGAEGAGCLIGSIIVAGVKNKRIQSFLFISGAFIFLTCIFLFSISEIYFVSLLLLFFGGLGISGFSTMQSVITVDRTQPELRGSALGYLSTTIGTQPLGALNVGITCSILAPHVGIRVSALEGILCMIIILFISAYYNRKING